MKKEIFSTNPVLCHDEGLSTYEKGNLCLPQRVKMFWHKSKEVKGKSHVMMAVVVVVVMVVVVVVVVVMMVAMVVKIESRKHKKGQERERGAESGLCSHPLRDLVSL